uniref:Uncharacterized protein n=1 Tax=Romanomermis culicivorax TaxID=13658 RepID=A0A915J7P6_ROMCU
MRPNVEAWEAIRDYIFGQRQRRIKVRELTIIDVDLVVEKLIFDDFSRTKRRRRRCKSGRFCGHVIGRF